MANIQFSVAVADARGAVGGVVFSRGAGGPIMRNRSHPVNPRSSRQQARRTAVAWISKYWSNDLTDQQRLDWRAYAAGTSWTNKLGQSISINGLAAFMRLNTLHRLIPSVMIAEAPTAMGHAGGVDFSFLAESDTSKIQFAEPTGAFDKDTNNHNLWMFQGLPTEPGAIAIPKGMRYIGRMWGSLGDPLVYPYEIDSAYTMRAGQLVTIKLVFQDDNNRVAGEVYATATAAPSV